MGQDLVQYRFWIWMELVSALGQVLDETQVELEEKKPRQVWAEFGSRQVRTRLGRGFIGCFARTESGQVWTWSNATQDLVWIGFGWHLYTVRTRIGANKKKPRLKQTPDRIWIRLRSRRSVREVGWYA
jgi:hypothetical protein